MITSWPWIRRKCRFMSLGSGSNLCNFSCDDIIIKNCLLEKVLGLTIDNLIFSDHISNICKTANQSLNALFKVLANVILDKCSLLINSFIKCHNSYCPLISWNYIPCLYECSVIEKVWRKSTKYKNAIYV